MHVVLEYTASDVIYDKGKKIIRATLQSFDILNRNGRIYPLKKVKKAIEEYLQMVESGEAFGEFGHPTEHTPERLSVIHPQYVSHVVKKAYLDGNLLKAVIVPVGPYKHYLIELATEGKIGFSARVFAERWIRNEKGHIEPEGNIKIICYDTVIIPSHKEAYVESVTESFVIPNTVYATDKDIECNTICNQKLNKYLKQNYIYPHIKLIKF